MRRLVGAAVVGMLLAPFGVAVGAPECVGVPSRQTVDPLSPPCISSWEGDNGGSTYTGVTSNRVEVVLYNDLGISGDLTQPWSATDEAPAHLGDVSGATTNLVRTAKALVAHFNDRYQTYGRVVRVIAYPSPVGETSVCAVRQTDVTQAILTYQPFAVATVGAVHGCIFNVTEQAGIVGLGMATFTRDAHVAEARNAYTFAPTTEANVDAVAGFICNTLAYRPARFAGNPMTGATRKFALIYQATDPWIAEAAIGINVASANRCGVQFSPFRSYPRGMHPNLVSAVLEARTGAGSGVPATTVICVCPATSYDAHVAVTAARAIGYQPEWLWVPEARIDRASALRELADPLGAHFGVSSTWMAPEPDHQHASRAARDADPALTPNAVATTDLFLALRLLFTAVQTAGPDLTPSTVRDGLTTLDRSAISGEGIPGGFTPGTPNSWTNSFVAWSFDFEGVPPGALTTRGCMRLYGHGARFTSSQWPVTDSALRSKTWTCSGDLYRRPLDTPVNFATVIVDGTGLAPS